MKTKLFTIALLFNTLFSFAGKPFKCTIKGVVINRNSKNLILIKASDDAMGDKQVIPIRDNKFQFAFDVKETQAYELIFEDELNKGNWFSVIFFPIAGQIDFKLYPYDQSEKDKVIGGQLNKDYEAYKLAERNAFNARQEEIDDKEELLEKNKEYYSAAYDSVMNIIDHTKDHTMIDKSVWLKRDELLRTGEAYTAKGKLLKKGQDILQSDQLKRRYNYISHNHNLVSYYFIVEDIKNVKDDPILLNPVKKNYPQFAATYPSHPYTQIIKTVLYGLNQIKPGEHIINVSLPDINGKTYNLNELSKDKITLIDFWGSWCGPCIAATRTMLPIYREFKDKGFTIIGIAKEYKSTNELKYRLNIEKYPWLNLVEMDDKNGIWNKFGIINSTGMMLLIDKHGKILAVDPTAEEVKEILTSNL